jgi:cytochrome c
MNYRLHCEGCHKADGSGQEGFIPALRGNVSRFLATSEGRTYLARVPGTAQSLLSDGERAAVLNWIVATFDPEHLPVDFAPYTPGEVAPWRTNALSQPGEVRARLVAQIASGTVPSPLSSRSADPTSGAGSADPSEPPTSFAICGACHTVSKDGTHGIGPNLRGVVGRRAGSAAGFAFSPAMRNANLTWTQEQLDEYLQAPAKKVPGNLMTFAGVESADDRKAIIEYLSSLR